MIPRLFDRVRALARLAAYGGAVFFVLAALAMRSAWGDVGESSMIVGRELMSMKDMVGASHQVRLNGEAVYVASATLEAGPRDVLDRVEKLCREGSRDLDDVVRDPENKLSAELRTSLQGMGPMALGIMRRDAGTEGVVGCLARPTNGGVAALSERLATFAKSHDLGDVGHLRYVYARQVKPGLTHVVTVWSEGQLRLDKLFPPTGEPAGSDPPGMPRVPGSTRLLSAEVDGAPYGIRIYDAPGSPAEALRFLDEQMPTHGWSSTQSVIKVDERARHFEKEGIELVVAVD
jgi:hypothetical protein